MTLKRLYNEWILNPLCSQNVIRRKEPGRERTHTTCWYTSLGERDLSEGRGVDGMIIFKWGKGKGYGITTQVFWDHKLCRLVNIHRRFGGIYFLY
jgi:hypothetical protein